MKENAVMIEQGMLCACGAQLSGPAHGVPRYCSKQCAILYDPRQKPEKVRCPECMKSVKKAGLKDHIRDAHTHQLADQKILGKLAEKYNVG